MFVLLLTKFVDLVSFLIIWPIILTLSVCIQVQAASAIAMHGEPKQIPSDRSFDYVNSAAPKGGQLVFGRIGSFSSLHHFIVRGEPAAGRHLTHQSLLARTFDEPFTLYALIAEDVSTPTNRSAVTFRLRPGARFHDGSEITVADVIFSYETLRAKGRPNHRFFYEQVAAVESPGIRSVTFRFKDDGNRELPLIMGMMPILSRASFAGRPFDRVSLTPLLGSGPYIVEKINPGHSIQYRRLNAYWARDLPSQIGQNNFDTIRYDYFRDDGAMLEAFKAGNIDLRIENDPKLWANGYAGLAMQAGRIKLLQFPHRRPAGMYAIVFNTRRFIFNNPMVRKALAYALDFTWLNRTYFHGAYTRTSSYFENSELAARMLPDPAEIALLSPFRDSLPVQVFNQVYKPPATEGKTPPRRNLRKSGELLAEAGWHVNNLRLRHKISGKALRFEILLQSRRNEKLALHWASNLRKLGIEVTVRMVDPAQYQQRTSTFDFDVIFHRWEPSLSPGNEQAYYWGSQAARTDGTRNYSGIQVPAIDALIKRMADASNRHQLVTAVRAMDRILQWGHYVVPLFHQRSDRLAIWNRFDRPQKTPLYGYRIETWWANEARLETNNKQ